MFGRAELSRLVPGPADGRRRAAECDFLAGQFGVAPGQVFGLAQVHGTRVHHIDTRALAGPPAGPVFAEGDGLFTGATGVVLVIRTADCLPVFFTLRDAHDRVFGVGAVHAGWKGLRSGVIEAGLDAACEALGKPAAVEIAIGPAIGADRYEVGAEVAGEFPLVPARPGRPGKFWLDLGANARRRTQDWEQTRSVPVRISRTLEACTGERNDRFYSHRAGDAGRNLNCIQMFKGEA